MRRVQLELNELSLEFKSLRESGIRRFPESSWQKVIAITKKIPIAEVSLAISAPIGYIRKKAKDLDLQVKPMRFVEAVPPSLMTFSNIVISVETSKGQKMKIEGVDSSSIPFLMSEFLKGDLSCSK